MVVLFDSSATLSFVSYACVKKLHLLVSSLLFNLVANMPTSGPVTSFNVCLNCPVMILKLGPRTGSFWGQTNLLGPYKNAGQVGPVRCQCGQTLRETDRPAYLSLAGTRLLVLIFLSVLLS